MNSVLKMLARVPVGLRRFVGEEDGLVTVEWVALTAGMVVAAVGIGYAVMSTTQVEAKKVGGGIPTQITNTFGANAKTFATQ